MPEIAMFRKGSRMLIRPTYPRMRVLRAVVGFGERGVNCTELYERLLHDGAPLTVPTIYRVAKELAMAGLLQRERSDDGKVFYRSCC